MYANLHSGIEIPVHLIEAGEKTISTQFDYPVIVGDRVFFDTIKVDLATLPMYNSK